MSRYFDEIVKSMNFLGQKDDLLVIGQTTCFPGTICYKTLLGINDNKKIEFPVAESFQMGVAIGLCLQNYVVLNQYVRFNFLLCATEPFINYLDKLNEISHNEYQIKMIIRTLIGSEKPLYPGASHVGDFTNSFKLMLKNTEVIRLDEPEMIFDSYVKSYERIDGKSTLLIEWADKYNE